MQGKNGDIEIIRGGTFENAGEEEFDPEKPGLDVEVQGVGGIIYRVTKGKKQNEKPSVLATTLFETDNY